MDVFDLVAKIRLDSSEYESGLNDAENKGNSFASRLGGGLSTAAKVGVGAIAAVGTATAAVTGAMVKGASNVAEYGDNIDKMSQKMGMSAEAYQEWDAIMQHSGTTIDAMKAPMKTLANAAQSGSDAFQKLGISEEEVKNLSQEDLFGRVISGLQGMEEGTERTALASDLLGRGATELGALLNTSAEDTEAMRQAVHDLGGVMSDDAVKASARFQDQLQDMQTALGGAKRNLMSDFLPSITTVMEGLTDLFSGGDGLGKISEGVEQFVDKLAEATPKVVEVGGTIVSALLDAIIENLPTLIQSGVDVIVTLVQGIIDALPVLMEALPTIIETIVTTLANNADKLVESALLLIAALAKGLIQSIPVLVKAIPRLIAALVNGLKNGVKDLITAGGNLVQGIWNGFVGKLDWIKAKIKGWVGNVTSFLKSLFKIGSPSKLFADEIGQYLPEGIAVGIEAKADTVYDQMDKIRKNVAKPFDVSVIGSSGTKYSSMLNDSGIIGAINEMRDHLDNMRVVLSTGETVGALTPHFDRSLGAVHNVRTRSMV